MASLVCLKSADVQGKKPLTDHLTRSSRGPSPTRLAWTVAGVLAAAVIALLLLWATAVGRERGLETVHSQLDEANAALAATQNQIQQDKDQLAALQAKVDDLQRQKDTEAQMAKGLEAEMRGDLESKDVTISNLQGKLTVSIVDNVMFDSGEAILKPDGQAVMLKIASILAEHPGLKIQVIGHTDNIPIRPEARGRFASNWELSTTRALAAVHFLTERAGVDPHRVGAIGYGEFRPVADNSTPEGRAKNRRIAITILPDEQPGAAAVVPVAPPVVPAPTPAPLQPTTSDPSGPPDNGGPPAQQ